MITNTTKILTVRKVRWDQLWHVVYECRGKETWDRMPMRDALKYVKRCHP